MVIVGGGFGGLQTARSLAGAPVRVTLVDRSNHHLFQPLLYQVASAVLSPSDIAAPIRWLLRRQANAEVLLAEARGVDLTGRRLLLTSTALEYDVLVLAAGMTNTWFGHDDAWSPHAPGLKSLDDALEMRRRILLAYERAEWTRDPDERRKQLTFVVVGGGPTGVELAGALSEIARDTLRRDFRHIDPSEARVVLVEGAPKVLGTFGGELPQRALEQLEATGVEVRLGGMVETVDANGVVVGGERIEAATVLWGAGVRAEEIGGALGVELDRAGRVLVEADCSVPGRPEVFVIGDLAHHQHAEEAGGEPPERPLPGVAQVAIQMGKHVARALQADRDGAPRPRFRYRDLGSMATVGRRRAVAEIGGLRFAGTFAWLTWLFVHLMALVGFRNRLAVLLQWSWSYLTFQRTSRLIRGSERAPDQLDAPPAESVL